MNTTCEALRDDLLAYRHHELPAARRLVVRWHLTLCAVCREELAIMEQITTDLLATESAPPLDAGLRTRILSAVDNAPPAIPHATPRRPHPVVQFGFGLAAMAVLAAILFPTFSRARYNARRASVESNLKQIMPDAGYEHETKSLPVTASPSAGAGAASADSASSNEARRVVGGPVRIDKSVRSTARTYPLTESDTTFADAHVKAPAQPQFARRNVDAADRPTGGGRNFLHASGGAAALGSSGAADLPSALRRVHKEARIAVAVAKVEDDADTVESYVKSAGGFIADNTLSTGGDGLKTATLTVRVPVGQFEKVLGQIAKLGDVKAKNVSGEDITEKFSDADQANRVLSSELGVKESQLKAALDRAAKDKKHPVDVPWQQRAEVRELRVLAAQAQARLDLMKKISDLANISVELQEQARPAQQTGLLQDMSDTGYAAFDTFVLAARVPLNLAIWILAYCPLWIPLAVAYRYYSRGHLRNP